MSEPRARKPRLDATMRELLRIERAIHERRPYKPKPKGGFTYIVGYRSGVVKVGSTANPDKRFPTLKREARAHGNPIVDARLSWWHADYVETESQLIQFCRARAEPRGREYFLIPFADDAEFALSFKCFDIEAIRAEGRRMTERLAEMHETLAIATLGADGDTSMTVAEAYQRGLAIRAAAGAAPP
jgi:hypothetical protein